MDLSGTLVTVGLLLGAITMIYLMKDPPAKGEPFDRKQKLMLIPLVLSSLFVLAASFLYFTRR